MGSSIIRLGLVAVLLIGMATAGCLGGDDAEPQDDGNEGPAAPTDSQGTIEGQVIDARNFGPLEGARVSIVIDQEAVEELETGASGEFSSGPLEPGTYQLHVNRPGFKGDVQGVQVNAGETVTQNVILEAFPSDKPWSEPRDFEGLMGLGYHGVGPTVTCCQADENHKISFAFEVQPDLLETMTIEMVWPEEHVGLRMNVWLEPNCDPACNPEYDYTDHAEGSNLGWGGLDMRIDRPDGGWPKISGDEPVELWIYVWADSGEEPLTVAYQQKFEIFMENFYVMPAPEGYSPRGDY